MQIEEPTQTSEILPFVNKNAAITADVYTLKTLIPELVLKSLEEPARELMETEEDQITTNDYVKKQILALQGSRDENAQEHVSMLLVLDALMTIQSATARSISLKGCQCSQYSKVLNDFILNNFTVKTERTR